MSSAYSAPIHVGDGPVDEVAFQAQASRGAYWNGARMLIAITAMVFGAVAFAYFYLRSLDSLGMWRPAGQVPPRLLGTEIMVFMVASALLFFGSTHRLRTRPDSGVDWRVGTTVALLLGAVAAGLQIWQLTRLGFFPGSSGYAGVFVASAPVFILWVVGGLYWMETLLARSIRLPGVLQPVDTERPAREVTAFQSSLDGCLLFTNFLAIISVVLYVLFYVL